MRKLVIVTLLALSTSAMADSSSIGLNLPSTPSTYGQDSIRTKDLDCKNAIGGATQLEFGVTGIVDNASTPFRSSDPAFPTKKDIGVYARIVIPLDKPKERINCNTLYQLELRRTRIEILKLQEELDALRRLNTQSSFEN